jgi:type II secretory pathway component PulF
MADTFDDLEVLLGELATLDAAGVDAAAAFDTLADRASSRSMRQAISKIHDSYRNGLPLSEALARAGTAVHPVVRGLVRAGEKSGTLGRALAEAAQFLALRRSVISSLRNAAIYPMFVLTVGSIVSALVAFYVVPRQWGMVESMHEELWRVYPGTGSHALLDTAKLAMKSVAVIFCGSWLACVALCLFSSIAPARPALHRIILRLPSYGSVFRRYLLFHFATAVNLQLSHGVPLPDALEALAASDDLPPVADAARSAHHALELGAPLSSGLAPALRLWPRDELWFLQQAEKMQRVPEYFARLAAKMTDEIRDVEMRVRYFEPLAVTVLGIMVAMFAISVFLPASRWYTVINLGE